MSLQTFQKNMIRHIKRTLIRIFKVIYKVMLKVVKTDDKTVVFISFHGRGYSCNPKYIHKQMCKDSRFDDYTFVWALKKPGAQPIEHAKQIRYNTLRYFYTMCKAKYWVVNCKLPFYIVKKPDQIYLQTWHGTPLKRLAHDIVQVEGQTFYRAGLTRDEMAATYDRDVAKYNYMIAPNPFSYEVFQSAFRINKERLIQTGYPRNDYLVQVTPNEIDAIKERFGLPKDKKVLLYAPTWRDNSYNVRGYLFELKANFKRWKEMLSKEYVILFKPHYLIINTFKMSEELEDFVYLVDADADINDCYVASDVLVTDYSSVFFDYANLQRPIYFYMFDLEEYADELRGFYFDIHKDLPGDIFVDEEELLTEIVKGSFNQAKLESFSKEFNIWQDGRSSQKVIDIVFGEGH